MYMRLVHLKIKSETLSKFRQHYDEKIIPRLKKMPGILYAGLMQSEHHQDECISMTLWDSQTHTENYENSGLYEELLQGVQPYLSDSLLGKIQLSKELKLEYQPVQEEPIVKSYAFLAKKDSKILAQEKTHLTYLRIVSVKIKPGKMKEFMQIYKEEIIPTLRAVKGCRCAYLTESIEEKNEAISVTMWDSKEDADDYERSGLFDELTEKLKHTFAELYQWKMALEKEGIRQAVTSEDLDVKYYSIITGKSFQ